MEYKELFVAGTMFKALMAEGGRQPRLILLGGTLVLREDCLDVPHRMPYLNCVPMLCALSIRWLCVLLSL